APARVQAMDTGGAWVELARKDWGDWAASFRIEPGHDVRFRALVDGDWVESCWFTHPGGRTPGGGETCGGGGSTPAEGFDASFRPKAGNAWWVEVFVDADRPLAGVDARADGGAWVPLEKRSWGAWARSFHVPDGSIVEFRARAADGSTDVSERYRWPSATRVDGGEPAPGTVDVAFAPKAGNAWWVEAIVVADGQPVTRVEARAAGGAWHEMAYREWGAWAASFHVPAGAQVEFRATTPDGTDVSHRFTWPDARPIGSAGAWPEEGSYARYDVTTQLAPGVMEQRYIDHVYHDGRWWHHVAGHFDDGHQRQEIAQWGHDAPPRCATEVAPGSAGGCYGVTVLRKDAEATHREGDPFTAATWYGEHVPDCRCNNDHAEWDQATGLVVGHYNSGTTWVDRLLLDTDAPMRAA
ncbi:MAG TPA: hypothetical protein VFH47_08475, partial [Candidatus Thermoplasmatota archaeon]|nr:hypothetical protein [Candidatus Thermoplasmatota archaeon]